MCTVSWRRDGGEAGSGYRLWFNRDERHTRGAEGTPQQGTAASGVSYLCPLDGERGGTWLAVNDCGLSVALLNDYTTPGASDVRPVMIERPSRGTLVRNLAGSCSLADLRRALGDATVVGLPPFHLAGLAPGRGAASVAGWHWDGRTLHELAGEALVPPWSSSSFRPAEVIADRRARYAAWINLTDAEAWRYHESHDAGNGAFSVNMSRSDAATRSICGVTVSAHEVALEYRPQAWPGAPRSTSGPVTFHLARG